MLRRTGLVLVVVLLAMSMAACAATPQKTVSNFFDYLKGHKFPEAAALIEGSVVTEDVDLDTPAGQVLATVYDRMTYVVSDRPVISGSRAQVNVSLTSIDVPQILMNFFGKAFSMVLLIGATEADDAQSEEMITNMFLKDLQDPNAPMTTTEITMHLVKTDGAWKIDMTSEENQRTFLNALMGDVLNMFPGLDY